MIEDKNVYYAIINKSNIKVFNSTTETSQSRYVLKTMLNYFNIELPEIEKSKNGKPYFKDSNIYFNYSHSKNYIACTISRYEVGIDIEETTRTISDDIAKKYLNDEKDNSKRIETWVKKEAYSKLKGLGLQINFQNIKLNEIMAKNLFINKKEYMCSIYCENSDIEFKELSFIRSEL